MLSGLFRFSRSVPPDNPALADSLCSAELAPSGLFRFALSMSPDDSAPADSLCFAALDPCPAESDAIDRESAGPLVEPDDAAVLADAALADAALAAT